MMDGANGATSSVKQNFSSSKGHIDGVVNGDERADFEEKPASPTFCSSISQMSKRSRQETQSELPETVDDSSVQILSSDLDSADEDPLQEGIMNPTNTTCARFCSEVSCTRNNRLQKLGKENCSGTDNPEMGSTPELGSKAAGARHVQSDRWIGWPSDSDSDDGNTSETAGLFDTVAASISSSRSEAKPQKKYRHGVDNVDITAAIAQKEKNLLERAVLEPEMRKKHFVKDKKLAQIPNGKRDASFPLAMNSTSDRKKGDTERISVSNSHDLHSVSSNSGSFHYSPAALSPRNAAGQAGRSAERRFGTPECMWERFSRGNGLYPSAANCEKSDDCIFVAESKSTDATKDSVPSANPVCSGRSHRKQSEDCMIVDDDSQSRSLSEEAKTAVASSQEYFRGSSGASDYSITISSTSGTEGTGDGFEDDSWLSAVDLGGAPADPVTSTRTVLDDSIQFTVFDSSLDYSSEFALSSPPVQVHQGMSNDRERSRHGAPASSSGISRSTELSWHHSLADFDISDDEMPDSRVLQASRAPAFAGPGQDDSNDCVIIPDMPTMTDEEYAHWLQDQINAEESYLASAADRRAMHAGVSFSSAVRSRGRAGRGRSQPWLPRSMRRRQAGGYHHFDVDDFWGGSQSASFNQAGRFGDSSVAEDSYEENLRLEEAIGDVQSKAMPRHIILQLPTHTYTTADISAKKECHICMCTYERGDTERVLPCFHTFHVKCIDQWFEMQSTCPVCRESAMPQEGM